MHNIMKSIKLTENHKSKLLEMCKKLFTESYTKTWDIEELFDYEPIDYENFQCFHWYEFCMTHLFYELYDNGWRKENPNCVVNFHLDLHNDKTHVVDCLYKEFKKLQ